MNAAQRRDAIWNSICKKRQVTIQQLADRYEVSSRTIYNDISILSVDHPLEYAQAYRQGCVKLPDWYQTHSGFTHDQLKLLYKAQSSMKGDDAVLMTDIIKKITHQR